MLEIREKLRLQKEADSLVSALRVAQRAELHSSPAVAAACMAGAAERVSIRPRPPSGKVETTAGAATASAAGAQGPQAQAVGAAAVPAGGLFSAASPRRPPAAAAGVGGTADASPAASSKPVRIGSARSTAQGSSGGDGASDGQQLWIGGENPQLARPKTAYVGAKRDWLPIDARAYARQTL
jgi:hypothetical protein